MNGLLALEDGRVFRGSAFGAAGTATGEACFNTSMTGYQEVITDPSYRGQIVSMTYPLIGNYGTNLADHESSRPHVQGFVIGELSPVPSNWRSEDSLAGYLQKWGVIGLEDIDTRALTKHLRTRGAMRALISAEAMTDDEAVARARASTPMSGSDYVKEVSTPDNYVWDPSSTESCEWSLAGPLPLPPITKRVVAYDFGIKTNILRNLASRGVYCKVYPAKTTLAEMETWSPQGYFLSNGPGDPAVMDYAVDTVKDVLATGKPVFGICLGHQLLASAVGVGTYKMHHGHRGLNHPIKNLMTGKSEITSQNHGFNVVRADAENNAEVEITHVHLNDNTVAGIKLKNRPAFSVQYHPESSPGPHDSRYLFDDFISLITKN